MLTSQQTKEEMNIRKHAALVLLLTRQVRGFPTPAAHERPWLFWFDLATVGLISNYYRNRVPPKLEAQARDNFLALALGQSDVDVVHRIITRITARNDPYFDCIATALQEHAERPQRNSQGSRGEALEKRRRLDISPEPLGDARSRVRHQTASETSCRSGSRPLSAHSSPAAPVTAITPEERQHDRSPTPPTSSGSAGPAEIPRLSLAATKDPHRHRFRSYRSLPRSTARRHLSSWTPTTRLSITARWTTHLRLHQEAAREKTPSMEASTSSEQSNPTGTFT